MVEVERRLASAEFADLQRTVLDFKLCGGVLKAPRRAAELREVRNFVWTYPDYRRAEYHLFFTRCRDYFRGRRT